MLPPYSQVPYKGVQLQGEDLVNQVDRWVAKGTIEPSAGSAIKKVSSSPQWRDLSDKYFVLLGAGSAMGPLKLLLDLGANVIAIDLDRPKIWERLLKQVEGSRGTLTFPTKVHVEDGAAIEDICSVAGCNLITQTPEILNWLKVKFEFLCCAALSAEFSHHIHSSL